MAAKIDPDSPLSVISVLGPKLDARQPEYLRLEQYADGNQPLAFLSPEVREELGNKLESICINWPQLVVGTIAERMQPQGWSIPGKKSMTAHANAIWQRNNLDEQVPLGIQDALTFGRSYGIVWGTPTGEALITIESPFQTICHRDPGTRVWDCALKRWVEEDGRAYAYTYHRDKIVQLQSKSKNADVSDLYGSAEQVTDLSHLGPEGWIIVGTIPNPLGEVVVRPIPNLPRSLRPEGTSELSDILTMVDGICKLATDMMVTSEFYSRGRRWATATMIEEDLDGNVRDDLDAHKRQGSWHLFESEQAHVGQFSEPEIRNFVQGVDMLAQYLSATKRIPAHYMDPKKSGLASAEAVRASESPLIVYAMSKWLHIGGALEDLGRLALMVETGDLPTRAELGMETNWKNPENLTEAQRIDAAAKRVPLGVPREQLWKDAGYTNQQIEDMKAMLAAGDVVTGAPSGRTGQPGPAAPPRANGRQPAGV